MIEAVGERWWPCYLRTLDERLAPGGRIGLQSILMPHDRMMATRSSWTWIHKYIFPGGLIPSDQAIRQTLRDCTTLEVVDQMHFGESYARDAQPLAEPVQRPRKAGRSARFRPHVSENVDLLSGLQRGGIS